MLLEKIQLRHPIPEPLEGYNLMHQGLYAILRRQLDHGQSVRVIELLKPAYADWNELRVSQAQEIAVHLKPAGLGDKVIPVARDVREYLQEVFQRSHGLDLEFLRDDPIASARFISILPFIGTATASYLMWIASGEELPVTPTLVRVLDRIGLMSRQGGSMKKARAAIYVGLGWAMVPMAPALLALVGWRGIGLLVAGGVFYTLGAVVYALRRPDPFPRTFGFHEIFHLLVIAAAACHFAAVAGVAV